MLHAAERSRASLHTWFSSWCAFGGEKNKIKNPSLHLLVSKDRYMGNTPVLPFHVVYRTLNAFMASDLPCLFSTRKRFHAIWILSYFHHFAIITISSFSVQTIYFSVLIIRQALELFFQWTAQTFKSSSLPGTFLFPCNQNITHILLEFKVITVGDFSSLIQSMRF